MTTSPEPNSGRAETRVSLEATIFLEVIASDSQTAGSVVMCNSLDLSPSGLQVVVDEDVAVGSILRLCADIRDDDPIFLVGEVKWKRPDEEPDAWRLGFLLYEADGSDIDRWKRLVLDMPA